MWNPDATMTVDEHTSMDNATTSYLHDDDHDDHSNIIILFPFVVIILGAAAHEFPKFVPEQVAIPYTSLLLIVGAIVGLLMKVCGDKLIEVVWGARE